MPRRTSRRRGYPLAVLIALDAQRTTIYRVYSESAKLDKRLPVANRRERKEVYAHNEAVVDELRPLFREGFSSLVISSPPKTRYASQFMDHLRKHHRRITVESAVSIKTLVGSAETDASAYELIRGSLFRESLRSAVEEEEKSLLALLERYLTQGETVYTIREASDLLTSQRLQYIIFTSKFYEAERRNSQFQSLLQQAQNSGVKTRIVKEEGTLGARAMQLGGMVGLVKT